MSYTTETKVYNRTGLSSAIIRKLTDKSESDVTTLIEGYISDAEQEIRKDIEYPIILTEERHLGTSYKNTFELGPQDDPFATEGSYDPINGVIEVYDAFFGSYKRRRPNPESADTWTEYLTPTASGWNQVSNVTITGETTEKVAGSYSVKMVFSAAGSARFPDNSNLTNLDLVIWNWTDLFMWIQTTNTSVATYIDLYDKDGNYDTQQLNTLIRQNNVGQYIWLDLATIKSNVDWTQTRLQYFVIRAAGAVTIYMDNLSFGDGWSFTAPYGYFHVSVADNIASEANTGYPSNGAPFFVSYSYDPFLASVPREIAEAAEWWCGIQIIDLLRGAKYIQTDFYVFGETLESDQTFQRGGLLGVRTRMVKNYQRALSRWGPGSYGVV